MKRFIQAWQKWDVNGWRRRSIAWPLYALTMVVLLAVLLWPVLAQATPHSVTLSWTASVDGGVVTVYRAAGACSTTSVFASITTGVATNTYTDTAVTVGSFCYQVTTVVNGLESGPSNQITARILPASPTTLTISSSQ